MSKYEIVADYCDGMSDEEFSIREEFVGSWPELQQEIKEMRKQGCYYNISAECICEEEEEGENHGKLL